MEKYYVYLDYTIKEVIEKFDKNHDRVAVVLNKNHMVVGVISQGDIIRALCSGETLFARVEKIIRPSFLYLRERNLEEAYKIFKKKMITMLPIVDDDYHLADVITLNDIYSYLEER